MLPYVTCITPTGDRPEALDICSQYMSRQNYQGPVQWIVVDDGKQPHQPPNKRCEYYRRQPAKYDPECTVTLNYWYALDYVRGDIIIFIDDDDWYSPSHISKCVDNLSSAIITGNLRSIYYHVGSRNWADVPSQYGKSSLCQTAMRVNAIDRLSQLLSVYRGSYVDLELWPRFYKHEKFLHSESHTVIGMKGMPGAGIVSSHKTLAADPPTALDVPATADTDMLQLMAWIGQEDAKQYAKWFQPSTSAH